MDHLSLRRWFRLGAGLLVAVLPVLAFLSVQVTPPAAVYGNLPGSPGSVDGLASALLESANFPLDATATYTTELTIISQTIVAAQTQTAVARTQTAIPATQTSIARTQTAVAQPTSTAIFVDQYEPNDTIDTAYTTAADAAALCNATFWPPGDIDYYRFELKAGLAYEIRTSNLSSGLDTFLAVYNPQGQVIATNDDYEFGSRASRVRITASQNGFYYARITNQSAVDTSNKTYCFQVNEIQGTATPTRVPGADDCEPNNTFETACTLGIGESFNANFVPVIGEGPDNDFYRFWVKPGYYTCETFNLSPLNDTNIIMYNQNREGLAGSQQDRRASEVSVYINYTGWIYALVGPVVPIDYHESHRYTYSFRCEEVEPTPTPTPSSTPTRPPAPPGVAPPGPTPTEFVFPTFPPSPTPFTFETPTPTPRPAVQIMPLATATPFGGPPRAVNINITVYYDANMNFTPELNEGIADVAVALYDQATGQLLAFGYTNEAGMVQFSGIATTGPIRVTAPFLNFSQLVTNSQAEIFIRVAPQPLPIGIP